MRLTGRTILLIISGGIAAYKSLELLRLLKREGAKVPVILTKGGAEFVTPLSITALSGDKLYQELFSLTDEAEMGHIRLARDPDLIIAAPASANFIERVARGQASDLASAVLLATDRPLLISPAMNPFMWKNQATADNIQTLKNRGIEIIDPDRGEMACGETGQGRLPEAPALLAAIIERIERNKPLAGKRAIVTSGPTHEAIDSVRYIANNSSGKQGHAIAQALADAGAAVTLISGPVNISDPKGVETICVVSADDMYREVMNRLPADIAVCAAAVADWKVKNAGTGKIKKQAGAPPPSLEFVENPDILASISRSDKRPKLVIGFAAEDAKSDDELLALATKKRDRKQCDWLLANAIHQNGNVVFGSDNNSLLWLGPDSHSFWGAQTKENLARQLVEAIGSAEI